MQTPSCYKKSLTNHLKVLSYGVLFEFSHYAIWQNKYIEQNECVKKKIDSFHT